MHKQLVKNNEPIFVSSYAAYTSEEEASIIVKEIIANIYSAAFETKYLGQFQLISYLSPNVSIKSHYSTIKSILLASPVWVIIIFHYLIRRNSITDNLNYYFLVISSRFMQLF